jgi:hypothetical protein
MVSENMASSLPVFKKLAQLASALRHAYRASLFTHSAGRCRQIFLTLYLFGSHRGIRCSMYFMPKNRVLRSRAILTDNLLRRRIAPYLLCYAVMKS